MSTKVPIVRAAILLIVLLCLGSCHGAVPEKVCNEAASVIGKSMTGTMSDCSKKMKFKNLKEKNSKTNCVFKCVMIAVGLLDPKGFITDESIRSFIEEIQVPDIMRAELGPLFGNCKNKAGTLDPSPADEFCKTYDPFIKCLMNGFKDMCTGSTKS